MRRSVLQKFAKASYVQHLVTVCMTTSFCISGCGVRGGQDARRNDRQDGNQQRSTAPVAEPADGFERLSSFPNRSRQGFPDIRQTRRARWRSERFARGARECTVARCTVAGCTQERSRGSGNCGDENSLVRRLASNRDRNAKSCGFPAKERRLGSAAPPEEVDG